MGKSALLFLSGVILGFLLSYPIPADEPVIRVVKEYEPVIRYKFAQEKVLTDPELLKMCYTSAIQIEPTFGKGYVEIECQDACKQSLQRFDVSVSESGGWRLYVGIGIVGAATGILISKLF